MLFQQGKVEAITGDDTILAGFVAQDPYAKVVGEAFSAEPYGIGVAADQVDLVQFVNGVLDQAKADGSWAASYDRVARRARRLRPRRRSRCTGGSTARERT